MSALSVADGALRVIGAGEERAGAINHELVATSVTVRELRPIERTLEDVFFALTERR